MSASASPTVAIYAAPSKTSEDESSIESQVRPRDRFGQWLSHKPPASSLDRF